MAKAQAMRTHCPQGHPYDERNTMRLGNGRRRCKTCAYAHWRDTHPRKRPIAPTLAERLWASFVRDPSGCWYWTKALSCYGYGHISIDGQEHPAHRVMYEVVVGPIGESSLTADHQCHNVDPDCGGGNSCPHRACVNPSHIVPATIIENLMRGEGPPARNARKTHCPQGHEYLPDNTYRNPTTGHRLCRACRAIHDKARRS